MKKRLILLIICLLSLSLSSFGQEARPQQAEAQPPKGEAQPPLDPFDKLALETLIYFTPLKGTVISVEGGVITASIKDSDGAKKGMRLGIFREGEPYYHPITKEVIAKAESKVGTAEVMDVSPGGSRLTAIEGTVREGDILRLSSAKIRTLFYQAMNVPWGVAEEHFETLQRTGRFELIGISALTVREEDLASEAKKSGAELLMVISSRETEEGVYLSQRLAWASDLKTFAIVEALIEKGYARELKVGEEFFSPADKPVVKVFDLPFVSGLIASGDIDGDGSAELALSTGKDIVFYRPGVTLKPAIEGATVKGARGEEHIHLDLADMDGDGRHEVLLTSLASDRVISYLYEFKGGKFVLKNKWNFFVRVVDGKLWGQNFMRGEGFRGGVFALGPSGERLETGVINLPVGINLYDFISSGGVVFAYDNRGYLSVYDEKWIPLYRSPEGFGGPVRVFIKEAPTEMATKEEWSIKDRLIVWGDRVFAIKRVRASETAPGFGFKQSGINALRWNGVSMEQRPLVEVVPGKALDFAVIGDSVAVVSEEMKISNIIKGLGITGTKLYVYPLGWAAEKEPARGADGGGDAGR